MNSLIFLLLLAFGLIALVLMFITRGTLRRVIAVLSLLIINLAALAVITAFFLVSRLDGAGPPGLLQVLALLWPLLLLTALLDAAFIFGLLTTARTRS